MGTIRSYGYLAAAALLLSACGSSKAVDNGTGAPLTLLNETFGSVASGASSLTTKWVVSSTTLCTASNTDQDVAGSPSQGNPTYALVMTCQGAQSLSAPLINLKSVSTYILNTPMTFAADARTDLSPIPGNPAPGMDFALEALNTGAQFAKVIVGPASATFVIKSGNTNVQTIRAFTADGLFHRYTFVVDGVGNAEWRRDGALQANTALFSTATGDLYLKMQAPPSTSTEPSSGHFDNVLITKP